MSSIKEVFRVLSDGYSHSIVDMRKTPVFIGFAASVLLVCS